MSEQNPNPPVESTTPASTHDIIEHRVMEFNELFQSAPHYGLASAALRIVYKLASNHVEHNTQAIAKLADAVTELTIWLKSERRA